MAEFVRLEMVLKLNVIMDNKERIPSLRGDAKSMGLIGVE